MDYSISVEKSNIYFQLNNNDELNHNQIEEKPKTKGKTKTKHQFFAKSDNSKKSYVFQSQNESQALIWQQELISLQENQSKRFEELFYFFLAEKSAKSQL